MTFTSMDFARLSGNGHLFDIASPLAHDKLIEHLHRPNLGCHNGVLQRDHQNAGLVCRHLHRFRS